MLTDSTVKKADTKYVLLIVSIILAPIAVLAACMVISFTVELPDSILIPLIFGPFLFGFLLYLLSWKSIKKRNLAKTGEQLSELEKSGFVTNISFNGSCKVMVDTTQHLIALQFGLNPSCCFVLPADRITKAWVNDGKKGRWFLEGSREVSFLFLVDGVRVKVPTFFSNQRYAMNSKEILTGISKADVMAELLNKVRGQVQ